MDLRVVLADDHGILREGIRRALEDEPGIEVVGEAKDGREAVRTVLEQSPDLVIMDISMPGLNGIDASQQILKDNPDVKILILSMYSDQFYVERALKAGVSGYVLKNSVISEVVSAIRVLSKGKVYLSPDIAGILVDDYVARVPEKKEPGTPSLTPREREVIQLLVEGLSSKEIAASLNLSERTVDSHRKNIMRKLDLHSLPQLTKFALREGFTSLET